MNPSEPIRPFSTLRFLYAAVLLLGGLLVALPSTAAAQTPCPLSADTTGQVTPQSCPGLDAVPPTVTIAPSSGTFTNASLAVTIEWCDNNTLNSASRKIMLNGAVVTSSFGYTGGTKTGCGAYATSTGTVRLAAGSNTLYAEIEDNDINRGSRSAPFTYSTPATYGVSVTPDGQAVTGSANAAASYGFTVQNTGNQSATFNLSAACSNGPTGCSAPASITVGAGATGTATVSYTAGGYGSSGTVQLTATQSNNAATSDVGSITVNVAAAPAPTVSIAPGGGTFTSNSRPVTITYNGTDLLLVSSRQILLNGADVTGSFGFTYSTTGEYHANGTDAGTVTLAPGANTLTASIRDAGGGTGTGTANYTLAIYGVSVTPDGQPVTGTANTAATQVFTVKNTGNQTVTFNLSPSCTGAVTGCSASPTSVNLAAGASGTVTVSYTAGAAPSSGIVQLTATQSGNTAISDPGSINVSVPAPPPNYGVRVTPDGQAVLGSTNATATQVFSVLNTGNVAATYNLTATCSGAVTNCSASASTTSPGPGAWAPVNVTYTAGPAGSSGTVQLTATQVGNTAITDPGSFIVTVPAATTNPQAPVLTLASRNPGTSLERDLCLTVAMAPAAAAECGDLRVVHPLPTTRTLNKARTPTLLYNSQHAHPYPLVSADVFLPVTAGPPDSVVAVLKTGTVTRKRAKWPGSQWIPGATRRVALGWDALSDTTGVYGYTLEVSNWYPGNVEKKTATNGQLVILNRANSPFGAGWWLAGLEKLVGLPNDQKLWIGGDGSTRVFSPVRTDVWAAPGIDHPDTLRLNSATGQFIRYLPGNLQVRFNGAREHVATVNRLGHQTTFAYTGGRLSSITLPTGTTARSYSFAYDTNNRLQTITAPPVGTTSRVVSVTNTSGRVTAIRDPDNLSVGYGYSSGVANQLNTRTDKRGTVATYAYDAALKLSQASISMGSGQPALVTALRSPEIQGLAPLATDPNKVYARLDGARTEVADTTQFYVDGSSRVTKIRDALGNTTTLSRTDTRWPGLVTQVVHPNGFTETATYNAYGNPTGNTQVNPLGDGRNATTQYAYGDTNWPDFVTRITAPEGNLVDFGYDPTTGNRIWQQDGRGSSARVSFGYDPTCKLPSSVRTPLQQQAGNAGDVIGYDPATCNVNRTTDPLGARSDFTLDGVGRVTRRLTPIDSAGALRRDQQIDYDPMGRDTLVTTSAPRVATAPAQTVEVRKFYNPEGAPDSIARSGTPNPATPTLTTRYGYDPAGRVVAERAADLAKDSTVYDPAGNATKWINRRGQAVTMQYDELNRLKSRVLPAVTYPQRVAGIPFRYGNFIRGCSGGTDTTLTHAYPKYPNDGGCGYLIAGDTHSFEYDELGNTRTANNANARVVRTFFPNGALKTEQQAVRTVTGGDFTQHVYDLAYGYDLNGRRREITHPSQLAPTGTGTNAGKANLTYNPQTGDLETVTDLLGNIFRYSYDLDSRPDALTQKPSASSPVKVTESYAYRLDGQPGRHVAKSFYGSSPLTFYDQTLGYDGRGKVLKTTNTAGPAENRTLAYSGLGYVVSQTVYAYTGASNGGTAQTTITESFAYDPLANLLVNQSNSTSSVNGGDYYSSDATAPTRDLTNSYTAYGRLAGTVHNSGQRDVFVYDAAGNLEFATQDSVSTATSDGAMLDDAASYYASDGLLRAVDHRQVLAPVGAGSTANNRSTFEEYFYDALGRRVLVRARRWCKDTESKPCRLSFVRRTVWDGDQELWEIQMPESSTYRENDTAQVPDITPSGSGNYTVIPATFSGRVGYTHGLRLDQPLSITRIGYADKDPGTAFRPVAPFTIVPLWDFNGQAIVGTYGNGELRKCTTYQSVNRCIYATWPATWYVYYRNTLQRSSWHGTLLEDKKDAAGNLYRRNRYYDPSTGRFTQEDPIGLAGGLNLYGFAEGDPVNFSDPFGLCPWPPSSCLEKAGRWLNSVAASVREAHNETVQWIRNDPVGQMVALGAIGALVDGTVGAGGLDTGEMSGMLRAASGKGNFGIGTVTRAEANTLGKAWVGEGYTVASDGRTLISKNGLRQYRPGSYKPNLGREQANLEWRLRNEGQWQGNAHIDITP